MSYTLLETVNYVISQTGGAPVTDINDPLPDVASAKLRIEEARVETLKRGLWFNTARGQEYNTDGSGQVAIGTDVLKVLKSHPLFLIPRDEFLYSPQLRSNNLSAELSPSDTITVDLVLDMAYEDMPYTAQDVIRYSAARQHVILELEDSSKAEELSQDLNIAAAALRSEELEINRYALDANPTARALEARKTLLAEGWWFNTERGVELTAVGGKFTVGVDTLKTTASSPEFCVPRNGYYYSTVTHTDTPAFSTLTLDRVVDVEFEDIPEEAKAVVRALAHRDMLLEEQALFERTKDSVMVNQGIARLQAAEADYTTTYSKLHEADIRIARDNLETNKTLRWAEITEKLLSEKWWFNTDSQGDQIPVADAAIPEIAVAVIRATAHRDIMLEEQALYERLRDDAVTVQSASRVESAEKDVVAAYTKLRDANLEEQRKDLDSNPTARYEEASKVLLSEGWWFNTERGIEIPAVNGKFPIAIGTLKTIASYPEFCVHRTNDYYSTVSNTTTPGFPVLTVDRVMEVYAYDIPEEAKAVIRALARRDLLIEEQALYERTQNTAEAAQASVRVAAAEADYTTAYAKLHEAEVKIVRSTIESDKTGRWAEVKRKLLAEKWWFNVDGSGNEIPVADDDMPELATSVIRATVHRDMMLQEQALYERLRDDASINQSLARVESAERDLTWSYTKLRDANLEEQRKNLDSNPNLRQEEARTALLSEGWWFNTERGLEIAASGGKFPVPVDTLKTTASSPEFCVARSGFYYSTVSHTDTPTFATLTVDRVTDLPYADVPEEAKAVIRAWAHRELLSEEQELYKRAKDEAGAEQTGVRLSMAEADYTTAYAKLHEAEVTIARDAIESNKTQRWAEVKRKVLAEKWWFNVDANGNLIPVTDENLPELATTVIRATVHRDMMLQEQALYERVRDDAAVSQSIVRVESAVRDLEWSYTKLRDANLEEQRKDLDANPNKRQEEARAALLSEGWWFNTERGLAITASGGKFPVPANTLKTTASYPEFCVARNGFYYSTTSHTDTPAFSTLTVDRVTDVTYDDVPEEAKAVIRAWAHRELLSEEQELYKRAKADGAAEQAGLRVTVAEADYQTAYQKLHEAEVRIARDNLESNPTARFAEAKKNILSEGWWFNTEYGVELSPAAGKFAVDADTLRTVESLERHVVARQGFYYDTFAQTDVFPAEVTKLTVDRIIDLPLEDVPEVAKGVIRALAIRDLRLKEQDAYEVSDSRSVLSQKRIEAAEIDLNVAYKKLIVDNKKFRYANISVGQTKRQAEEQVKVLKRGWWFNTETSVTITKDGDDKYPVPSNVLKVLRTYPQILVERSGFLYSMSENTDVFPDEADEVCVDVVINMPYSELPDVVQDVVRIRAEREWALNEDGDLNKVQLLDRDLEKASAEMVKDDLELRKHTRVDNPSFLRMRGGVRPYRRGGRTSNPNYPGGGF